MIALGRKSTTSALDGRDPDVSPVEGPDENTDEKPDVDINVNLDWSVGEDLYKNENWDGWMTLIDDYYQN